MTEGAAKRRNRIHFLRWDAVVKARENGGHTWPESYELAHQMLKGTQAQGAPPTMKDSYQMVEKARTFGGKGSDAEKAKDWRDLYHLPREEIYGRGSEIISPPGWGKRRI